MRTTMIVDFDSGLAWVLESAEYRFDYAATQEALNLMHNLRVSIAGEAGAGWQMLYRAMNRLEAECVEYFKGN